MKRSKATWSLVAMACLALAGCPKSDPPASTDGAAPSTSAASVGAGAGADGGSGAGAGGAGGEGGAAAPSAKGAAATYVGKYTVSAGTMYVPAEKDWASVKFKNDDTKLLGEGEMTVVIDASGRVSGTTEAGPLGASILDGQSDNGLLTATLRRKDPSDEGLTGTLVATVAGDVLAGTLNLAESNAAVVRVAKLEAKKK